MPHNTLTPHEVVQLRLLLAEYERDPAGFLKRYSLPLHPKQKKTRHRDKKRVGA